MDNRSGLVLFGMLVLALVFSVTLSWDALSGGSTSVVYGIFALAGFILCVAASFFEFLLLKREGVALSYWFLIAGIIISVIFIWYLTRCGTIFGWW